MEKGKILGLVLMLLSVSCNPGKQEKDEPFTANQDCIQIVLFHLAQRCESCTAVESETNAILEEEYNDELTGGKIRFLSFDIHSENGKKAALRLKATGQNLFVVKGDSISDLSGPAFLFAHTHPERYHNALVKEIEKYLD